MHTYLVTGCAGFIASRVAHQLLTAGHTVVGVDNLNDYYDVRIKRHRLEGLNKRTGFTFQAADIEDREAMDRLFGEVRLDAVINLAARAGVRYSVENPRVYLTTNALGTLNLLECMRHRGVSKLILASTSSLYAGQPIPFSEDLPVNTPISTYAASKKAAEMLCHSFHHLFGLDITILRYFTVYGPVGRPDMAMFRFIKWIDEGTELEIFGDGNQSRDFTFVEDVARGTILGLRPVGYEIINIGGGQAPTTINHVIRGIEERLGKKAKCRHLPFHKADLTETRAAIEKAARLLNWKPEIGIEEGLTQTVDWYLANRSWLKDVRL